MSRGGDLITFRSLAPSDAPAMSRLIDRLYEVKKDARYFLWHNFESPARVVMLGAFAGDELVGMFGLHRRKLTNGLICGQAKSMNVLAEWRGRGIFTKLGQAAFEAFPDLRAWCVFANENAVQPCHKAFGLEVLGPVVGLVRPIAPVDNPHQYPLNPIGPETKLLGNPETCSGLVAFDWNDKYRRWRYGLNPLYTYYQIVMDEQCYAVGKVFTDPVTGRRFGDIVDYEGPTEKLGELLDLTGRRMSGLGVEAVTVWALPHMPMRKAAEGLGFREKGPKTYFMYRALDEDSKGLSMMNKWHLRQADAENY